MFCDGDDPHLCITDIVNLASFVELKKAIDLRHLKIDTDRIFVNHVKRDVYRFGPIIIHRHWEDRGLYRGPASPGCWADTYSGRSGDDIVSLKLHLARVLSLPQSGPSKVCSPEFLQEVAAQFQPEASEQEFVDELVKRLGIDINNPNITQPAAFRGWSQVACMSASSPPLSGLHDDSAETWPDYRLDQVPFIGRPSRTFVMRDAMGRVQQAIGSWPTAWGRPLFLSFTLWEKDFDTLIQQWMFGRSTVKICPYGLGNALANRDAIVAIVDDLNTVDRENTKLSEYHGAMPPITFTAWPRGLYAASPVGTDWSQLRDRKVTVAVGNDRDSFVQALDLNDELLKAGVRTIEFVLPKKFDGGGNELKVDHEGGELRGIRKDASELAEIAKQKFGIFSKIMQTTALSPVWKIGDGSSSFEADLIMTPCLEKATINLLYSKPGVGKSWFALLIIYILATGGKLLGKFHTRKRFRCLYLAGETGDRICRRIEEIHAAMQSTDAIENIDVYPHPNQKNGKLNLECPEDWQTFKALAENYDVIVIDHLSAFTSGHNSADSWSRLHLLLRQLTEQGKTILLLHHAGKNGQQRGTSLLDADIDTKIHLTNLADAPNGFLVTFEKHRDDETLGQALQPFEIRWDRGGPGGLLRWATKDVDPSKTKIWAPLPERQNAHIRAVDEAFILATFEGQEAEIIRCLANANLKGKSGLKREEFDRHLGVSEETTRSVIKGLVTKCSVLVEGKGKATRYALSDAAIQSIINE